jgi:hypothetical protein
MTSETAKLQTELELRAEEINEEIRALPNDLSVFESACARILSEQQELITTADNWLDFIEKLKQVDTERNAWFYVMRDAVRKALKVATRMSYDRLEAISDAKEINNSVSYARAILRGTTRPLNANLSAAVHFYYIGAVTVPTELLFYHSDRQSYADALKVLLAVGSEFCEKIRDTELDGQPAIRKGWFFFVDCFENDVVPAIDAELRTIGVAGGVA